MQFDALNSPCKGELSAVIIRGNGDREDLGVISSELRCFDALKGVLADGRRKLLTACDKLLNRPMNLVTTAGWNVVAQNFVSASSPMTNFKFHDMGTGTTTPAIGDTTLQTPAGTARSTGTNSNPSTLVFQSVGTVTATSTLAITEWGLFDASTSGHMLDHRTFSVINLSNTDGIQFTYSLTLTAGGS